MKKSKTGLTRNDWLKFRIGKEHNKCIKVRDDDRTRILELRETGHSLREIASIIGGISRTTVGNVLNPERYNARRLKVKEEKSWRKYYSTAKNTLYQKRLREHIKQIFKKTYDNK